MCVVSHTAPYKHFKDKKELVEQIIKKVWISFNMALSESMNENNKCYKKQMVEMGKAYVKFMVENPKYLKFMFLSDSNKTIKIINDNFVGYEGSAFEIFRNCAEKYLKETDLTPKFYTERTVVMWSMVHGIVILFSKKSIEYNKNYLDLVEDMINNSLSIQK